MENCADVAQRLFVAIVSARPEKYLGEGDNLIETLNELASNCFSAAQALEDARQVWSMSTQDLERDVQQAAEVTCGGY